MNKYRSNLNIYKALRCFFTGHNFVEYGNDFWKRCDKCENYKYKSTFKPKTYTGTTLIK